MAPSSYGGVRRDWFGSQARKVLSLMNCSSARGMPAVTIAGGGWHAHKQTVGEDGVKDSER